MSTILTKTFPFGGQFGSPPYSGADWVEIYWATSPWEVTSGSTPIPINILASSLTARLTSTFSFSGGPVSLSGFIGNSYTPDQMMPTQIVETASGTILMLNSGVIDLRPGMTFSATANGSNPTLAEHLDCHLFGPAGVSFAGEVWFAYTK